MAALNEQVSIGYQASVKKFNNHLFLAKKRLRSHYCINVLLWSIKNLDWNNMQVNQGRSHRGRGGAAPPNI